jgi:hypothetical protein
VLEYGVTQKPILSSPFSTVEGLGVGGDMKEDIQITT